MSGAEIAHLVAATIGYSNYVVQNGAPIVVEAGIRVRGDLADLADQPVTFVDLVAVLLNVGLPAVALPASRLRRLLSAADQARSALTLKTGAAGFEHRRAAVLVRDSELDAKLLLALVLRGAKEHENGAI